MAVKYSDLEMAFDFASVGSGYDHGAYLDRESGEIFYDSDSSEEEIPVDLFQNVKYIKIPDRNEFGLGKQLALKYSEMYLPGNIDKVYSIFKSKGAYSTFKAYLETETQLENWYQYEQSAIKESIIQWCEDNSIEVIF